MAEGALFAGPALRRLRKREGLTQAAMAARLSISPSYLNLLERNQRPLSARVVVQVVDQFDFDPRALRENEAIGGLDGLARRLSDERFSDLGIDRDEVAEFLAAAPQAAAAFARMYDQGSGTEDRVSGPLEESRREIERWRNHFADLDHAAEELSDELRLSRNDIGVALADRLREKHQLALRILPQDVIPGKLRRLDLHARQLQLSEMLDPASRNFHVALQIALIEQREEIQNIAAGSQFTDEAARSLFERHLAGYFAAALVMPYSRFLRACDATGYDIPVLMRRFGVGFEQIAHRLTTLQRVGQRGLPFFMARIDRAGQFSKRFAGASGASMLEGNASCPLWNIHRAFERTGEFSLQAVKLEDAGAAPADWITIAKAVESSGSTGDGRFVVVLGVETKLAGNLAQARGLMPFADNLQPVGLGCSRCHRADCRQRSLPPSGAALSFDSITRGITPFEFGKN